MKKLILFFFFIGIGLSLPAQNLFVTSTSPVHGAENVDQDSIKITFNKKITFDDSTFTEGLQIPFLVLPFDSIQVTQLRLSDDSLSMIIEGNLADNTDFTFIVLDAQAQDGDKLGAPYLFRFTTNATAGQFVVNGKISEEEMAKMKVNSAADHLGGLTVILSEETLDIGLDFDDSEEGTEEEENDPLDAAHIALVDPTTGEYSIDGIREGDFFAFGLNLFSPEQENVGFPDLYIHDPNEDFTLDTVKVNSTDAPTDTLNNIDLRKLLFEPITLGEAFSRTSSLNFSEDVEAKAGIANIPLVFDTFEDPQPKQLFKGLPVKASLQDHQDPFFDPENGKSIIWSMYFYDSVKDSVYLVGISPFGAQLIETVSSSDLDIPVSISTLNSLPENFIDSDSAAAIAEMNGGAAFRQEYSNASFARVEFVAAHAYWEYPLDNTVVAPTHWRVAYEAEDFNFEFKQTNDHEGFSQDSLIFYIDISTGDLLYKAGNNLEDGPSFNVVSSSPTEGDVAVNSDTSTVSITFEAPIRFDEFGFFNNELEIIPFPLDSINIVGFDLSDAGRTLNFKVLHTADTDYTWIVSKARSTAGGVLERPYVFNYTTSSASGSQSVAGSVNTQTESNKNLEATNEFDGVMVALFTSNPFKDDGNESESEGPDISIARASLADTTNGTYTISGVRDGEYFPLAINLIKDGFGDSPSAIGIYDPDGDGSLNSITVSGGNLTDVNIQFKSFAPITASAAAAFANSVAAELDSGLELYFMFSEEELIEYDDFNDDFQKNKDLKKLVRSHFKLDNQTLSPTGTGEEWGLLYYNSTTEVALAFGVNPFGVGFVDTLDTQEFLEDLELEGATFEDLAPLPSSFFDSDSAAIVAEENGGSEFRQGSADYLYVEYIALNAPTLLPEGITADGGVWGVIYSKESFNEQTFNYEFSELDIFIDLEDGTFLGANLQEDEPFTALDGRAAADTLALKFYEDNKLYLIDARGSIFVDPEIDEQKKANSITDENLEIAEGKFFFIEYRYYSQLNNAETPLFVDANGEAHFSGNTFSPLPEGVSYLDLNSISESIIDSDSAVATANAEGAAAFMNNLGADFDLARLDLEVQAGNRYWLHPEGVDSSLITWTVRFLRTSKHKTTGEYEYESAEYLINAETGAVIDAMVITSNEDNPLSDIPNETTLGQNYPNPFNPTTTIPFSLKEAVNVEITIYNMLGQKVTSLVNERFTAGNHLATWDASSMASGMYIYRLKAGNVVKTKKLMLIK